MNTASRNCVQRYFFSAYSVLWRDIGLSFILKAYTVSGPWSAQVPAMPLVRDLSENDKIFRREKKYVELFKDSEFFVISTLEKYHKFRLAVLGPRPMTWLSKTSQNKKRRPLFSKNVLKIVPIHVYKFSLFNTSNTYRVFGNYFRPR